MFDEGYAHIFEVAMVCTAMANAGTTPSEKDIEPYVNGCEHAIASVNGFMQLLAARDHEFTVIELYANNPE